MRKYDYKNLANISLPLNIINMMAKIHEYKGKEELYVKAYPAVLSKMVEVAKIQSIKSSNAIEGIITTDSRLNDLYKKKSEPRNRNEEEIAGYRQVLDLIHENYDYIEFSKNDILTLHNQLYSYSYVNYKGKFKTMDNAIVEVDQDGNRSVRFQPVSSFETEANFVEMVNAYKEAVKANVPPLLLIPVLIHDFLCIHPFDDGNGRMSRILTLLLLYKFGFFVGRYISIEMIIEESKETYYEELNNSSQNWHSGDNDEFPFIRYMLGVILKAYEQCDARLKILADKKVPTDERILQALQNALKPLAKKDFINQFPDISQRTIERGLKVLLDNNKIEKTGAGRNVKYRLVR